MMNEHYFTKAPTSKVGYGIIKAMLRGREYRFLTTSGVFSYKRIDRGTELLVRHMKLEGKNKVLDLGCGYGVIGIVTAGIVKDVVLTEVNERAAKLALENLKLNSVDNAEVRLGNLYEPAEKEKFDAVLCNLPMSAGLEVVFEILDGSKEHLNPGGTVQVVVRKGAKRIEEKLVEIFGNVTTLAKKGGYRVFLSRMPG